MSFSVLRSVLALGLSLLACTRAAGAEIAGAASPDATRWIVTTARGRGARGELYFSSVRLFNPSAVDVTAEWSFLTQSPLDPAGRARGDNSGVPSTGVTVPAGRWVELAAFWPPAGSNLAGAVRITPTTTDAGGVLLPLVAQSVTGAYRGGPAGEALGPLIDSVGGSSLLGTGETGRIPHLRAGQTFDNTFRVNVFLLSTNADAETELSLALIDADGASRGERTITLGRLAQTQVNDVARYFGYVPCLHGCPSDAPFTEPVEVRVRVVRGGPVAAAGILIENESGSNLYVPAVKTAAP